MIIKKKTEAEKRQIESWKKRICMHVNIKMLFSFLISISNKVKKGCKKYVYLPWINSWSLIDFFYRWFSVNKRNTDFNMRKRNIQLVHSVHKFSLCEWVRETRKKSTTTTTEQQPQSGHTDGGDNSKEKHSRNDWTSVRSN